MLQNEFTRVYDRDGIVEGDKIRKIGLRMAAAIDAGTETVDALEKKIENMPSASQEAAWWVIRIAKGEYE